MSDLTLSCKDAFAYIAERIDALGADNVATVWQTAPWPLGDVADIYNPTLVLQPHLTNGSNFAQV